MNPVPTRKFKLILVAAAISALPFGGSGRAAAQDDSASMKMHEAMQQNMQQMQSMTMTGIPDEDFVRMMIPHHQAAIDAAKAEAENGKDPEIRKMAKKAMQEQSKEVAKMKNWLEKQKKAGA